MPVSECVLKTEAALKDVWGGGALKSGSAPNCTNTPKSSDVGLRKGWFKCYKILRTGLTSDTETAHG